MEKSRFSVLLSSVAYLISKWVFRLPYMSTTLSKHNLKITFKTEDALGRHLYKYGICEPENTKCFLENVQLKEGDIVLDVGANIGWYSLLFSRYGPANTQIFAFEPDPLNYNLLKKNIQQNNATQVTCYNQALSDKVEKKTLYLYPSKNRGRHSLLPINEGEQVEVSTITLDTFIDEHQLDQSRVKFIKIDVEGYEFFVLKGGQQLLEHVPIIHTEFAPSYMQKGGIAPSDFLDTLHQKKYTPHIIGEQGKLENTSYESLLHSSQHMDLLWMKNH
ncbi:MAG: FkbM family methyltransferase [Tunicatimonas sp.]|uniref:FkbM family methyltransferase n=1 Tax=Tunicatimonas sp. TaxID=1940096 RepID=UPI003C770A26